MQIDLSPYLFPRWASCSPILQQKKQSAMSIKPQPRHEHKYKISQHALFCLPFRISMCAVHFLLCMHFFVLPQYPISRTPLSSHNKPSQPMETHWRNIKKRENNINENKIAMLLVNELITASQSQTRKHWVRNGAYCCPVGKNEKP